MRAVTVFWGIPVDRQTTFYHADEVKSWSSAVDFPGNYLSSENYLYGTAVQYAVGILLTPVRLALDSPDPVQHQQFVLTAVLCFRLVNVLLGTAAVWLTFLLGRRFGGELTGVTAAVLLSVSTAHVMNSPLCTLDVSMSFLLAAATLLVDRALTSGRRLHAAQAGVVAGLLAGTKATGVFVLGIPCVMLAVDWWKRRPMTTESRDAFAWNVRNLLVVFLPVAGTVFAFSTPHVVLSFDEFLAAMQRQKIQWYERPTSSVLQILRVWFTGASDTLGPVGVCSALVAMVTVGHYRRQPRLSAALVSFVAGYFCFWGGYLPARFVVMTGPFLCVLSAAGLVTLIECLQTRRTAAGVVATVLLCAVPVWRTGCETLARLTDARTRAARFVNSQLPRGATLGVATDSAEYDWRHHQWRYPAVDWQRFVEVPFLRQPEFVVASSIELRLMDEALHSEKLQDGFIWDPRYRGDWYQLMPPSPAVFRFYDGLLQGRTYELIRSFESVKNPETGGIYPSIHVFRRNAGVPRKGAAAGPARQSD